jgi:hypothetical protein
MLIYVELKAIKLFMLTGNYPRNLGGPDPFAAVLGNPVVPIRQ